MASFIIHRHPSSLLNPGSIERQLLGKTYPGEREVLFIENHYDESKYTLRLFDILGHRVYLGAKHGR